MWGGVKETGDKEERWRVECYKYGEEGHKCRECPLWEKVERRRVEKRVACVAMPQKVQQKKKPACSTREEVQEAEKRLRRAKEEEVVHVTKP